MKNKNNLTRDDVLINERLKAYQKDLIPLYLNKLTGEDKDKLSKIYSNKTFNKKDKQFIASIKKSIALTPDDINNYFKTKNITDKSFDDLSSTVKRHKNYNTKNKNLNVNLDFIQDNLTKTTDIEQYGFGGWLKEHAGGVVGGLTAIGGAALTIGSMGALAPVGVGLMASGASAIASDINKSEAANTAIDNAEAQKTQFENTQKANFIQQKNAELLSETNTPQYAMGGGIESSQIPQGTSQQGLIPNNNYTGQTHEGADGGIPIDANGNPVAKTNNPVQGLAEDGEVSYGKFIFSDRLNIGKSNVSFADKAKKIMSKYKSRLGKDLEKYDKPAVESLDRELQVLSDEQEALKQALKGDDAQQGMSGEEQIQQPEQQLDADGQPIQTQIEQSQQELTPEQLSQLQAIQAQRTPQQEQLPQEVPAMALGGDIPPENVVTDDSGITTNTNTNTIGTNLINNIVNNNDPAKRKPIEGLNALNPADIVENKDVQDYLNKNKSVQIQYGGSNDPNVTNYRVKPLGARVSKNSIGFGNDRRYVYNIWDKDNNAIETLTPAEYQNRLKSQEYLKTLSKYSVNRTPAESSVYPNTIPIQQRVQKLSNEEYLAAKSKAMPRYWGGTNDLYQVDGINDDPPKGSLEWSNNNSYSNIDDSEYYNTVNNTQHGIESDIKTPESLNTFNGGSVTPAYIGAGAAVLGNAAEMISADAYADKLKDSYTPAKAYTYTPKEISLGKTRENDIARSLQARREALRTARNSGLKNYTDIAINAILGGNNALSDRLIKSEEAEDNANVTNANKANAVNVASNNRVGMFNTNLLQTLQNAGNSTKHNATNNFINSISTGAQHVAGAYQDRERFANTTQIMSEHFIPMMDENGKLVYIPKK